ncbi:MAG: sporulation protein [Ruminococcus sp.]|nr:sporulation protein [Ruminococcus sp.]
MKTKLWLKSAAAAMACVMTFSAAGVNSMAGDETTEGTEPSTELAEENFQPAEVLTRDKADTSEYDGSLSLISYELTTPDMYKLGDGLEAAGSSEAAVLSDEQEAMILLMRKRIRNSSPILGKKSKNATPTAVEVYSSGGELSNIPEPQEGKIVESNPGQFAIQSYGWGHGVGMSQNGANFYAKYAGWTYQDILYHYYPGTHLMNTGLTDEEVLTIKHIPAGETLDILAGIVYHEMGGCMAYEAMKAQAVAAYTFMKYNNDDSYDMRMKPDPPQIVYDACREVLGEALYYNDDYCLTMFYASSGGTTSNCSEIFCQDLPYLRTVSGDYDAAYDPHYGSVTYVDAATMRNRIETAYNITLSDDPHNWIQLSYSPTSGYINDVCIDGQIHVQGYAFSVAMGFKSCKFNLTYTDYADYDGDGKDEQSTPILTKDGDVAPPSELEDVPTVERPTEPSTETETEDPTESAGSEPEDETQQSGEGTTEDGTEPDTGSDTAAQQVEESNEK